MLTFSNKTLFFLFLIFTLIIISQSQKGRGGGGSSGGGGYGGGSYNSNYYRNRPYNSYGNGSQSPVSQTAGIVIGSVCGVFCCFALAVSLCKNPCKNGKNSQEIKAQFQRLKTTKNNVSNLIMKQKDYQKLKNQFFQMISAHTSIFEYTQSGQSTRILNTKIKEFPEDQFIDKIELSGSDQVGSWTGEGFFLAAVNGPYVWWMKNYDDKQSAGQVGDSQFLIYESTSYYRGAWHGKWYYEGDQFDQNYSGTWSLTDPTNQFAVDFTSESSPTIWNPLQVFGARFNPPPQ